MLRVGGGVEVGMGAAFECQLRYQLSSLRYFALFLAIPGKRRLLPKNKTRPLPQNPYGPGFRSLLIASPKPSILNMRLI